MSGTEGGDDAHAGSSKPLSGLSLYAGIQLSSQPSAQKSPTQLDAVEPRRSPSSPLPSTSKAQSSASTFNGSNWSAALRFAPRKSGASSRTQSAKGSRIQAASLVAPSFSSAPVEATAAEEAVSSKPRPPVAAGAGQLDRPTSLRPTSAAQSGHDRTSSSTEMLPQHLVSKPRNHPHQLPVITQPPELRLPDEEIEADRAIARAATAARGASRSSSMGDQWYGFDGADEDEDVNGFQDTAAGAKARKKKFKRKRARSPPGVNWDADYDPRIPNDFAAWNEVESARREMARQSQYMYGHQDEDDNDGRSDRDRMSASTRHRPGAREDSEEEEKLYLSPPPGLYNQPPHSLAADSVLHTSDSANNARSHHLTVPMSGEEAYQRRAAMSKGIQPTPDRGHHSALQQGPKLDLSPPQASLNDPIEPEETAEVKNTSASDSGPASSHMDLAARQSAAAAIAARLARAAPPTQANIEPRAAQLDSRNTELSDPAGFAERLMAQWGHQKGEGLGADGNVGRAEPLVMEREKAAKSSQSSRLDRWGGKPGSNSARPARGKFSTQDPRAAEDLSRFGSPSEVVLLENLIASADDIDDTLPEEISAECSRHGIVHRVAIQPPTRVFVVFTGPAGAWKCVRELNGRFFGGRSVAARYYNRADFERGDYSK